MIDFCLVLKRFGIWMFLTKWRPFKYWFRLFFLRIQSENVKRHKLSHSVCYLHGWSINDQTVKYSTQYLTWYSTRYWTQGRVTRPRSINYSASTRLRSPPISISLTDKSRVGTPLRWYLFRSHPDFSIFSPIYKCFRYSKFGNWNPETEQKIYRQKITGEGGGGGGVGVYLVLACLNQ